MTADIVPEPRCPGAVKVARRGFAPGDPPLDLAYLFNDEEKNLTIAAPEHGVTYVCQIMEKR